MAWVLRCTTRKSVLSQLGVRTFRSSSAFLANLSKDDKPTISSTLGIDIINSLEVPSIDFKQQSKPELVNVQTSNQNGGYSYKGAHFDKKTGKWTSSITVGGKKIHLGTFSTAKDASDAYFAAKNVFKDEQYSHRKKSKKSKKGRDDKDEPFMKIPEDAQQIMKMEDAVALGLPIFDVETDDEGESSFVFGDPSSYAVPLIDKSSKYKGVIREGLGAVMWEAVIVVNGKQISGGEYESEEDAAKAYDALARMYLGADAELNFPIDPYLEWVPPEEVVHTGQLETKIGVLFTPEELAAALEQERGIDVRVLPLEGRSDLADFLVFATGRSTTHMRKMADMVARGVRKRHLMGCDGQVENRTGDDWMVVDCGNIIVNIMDAESREVFDLEKFYEDMKLGVDPYAGMSYDEWLEANPVPEKWLLRLERDEFEMEQEQRVDAAPPLEGFGKYSFSGKLGGRGGRK